MGFRLQLDVADCRFDSNLRAVEHASWIFDRLSQGTDCYDVSS
ncbi:hypothetical protein SRABI91_04205 [Rhodococcoides fascians]|jgi:hypothetical protein|nr:hypothetical protein SRABI91_04205 [Rhodococcus fascians]